MNNISIILLVVYFIMFSACEKDNNNENTPTLKESNPIEYFSESFKKGIIAYYPFNNGSLKDASGNGHDLTNSSSAKHSSDKNGVLNNAFEFDNIPYSNEKLILDKADFLNDLDEFSISFWYQATDNTRNEGNFESLISRGSESSCPNKRGDWSIGMYDSRRIVFGRLNDVWENFYYPNFMENKIKYWHHVTASFNKKNNNKIKLYINGNMHGENEDIANCLETPTIKNLGNLIIGENYTGKIDDIIIHNRELTSDEIFDVFYNGPSNR